MALYCVCRQLNQHRRGQPQGGAASQDHHPLELVCNILESCRPVAASSAHPLSAHQTLPDGRHRLLARSLDITRHRSAGGERWEELHHHEGERRVTLDTAGDDNSHLNRSWWIFWYFCCCVNLQRHTHTHPNTHSLASRVWTQLFESR